MCPKIRKRLDKNVEPSATCIVSGAGDGLFQVDNHSKIYIVDFQEESCTCNRWDLSGIPCHHVVACCRAETKKLKKAQLEEARRIKMAQQAQEAAAKKAQLEEARRIKMS